MEGDSVKVALFGGTGFVGSYIVDELVSREHQPRLMVRPGSEGKVPKPEYCETVSGDIHDDYAIRETLYDWKELPMNCCSLEALSGWPILL